MYPIHSKYVVHGSSGSGKSALIELLEESSYNVSVHRKDSTREHRPNESPEGTLDLRFLDQATFEKNRKRGKYDIVYEKYGNLYGIRKDQLTEAFENKESHFLIIRDISAIRQFKYTYPDAKAIYIHADPKSIPERLRERDGMSPKKRQERTREEYDEYKHNNTLFDHVVLNFWDLEGAALQMKNIMHKYAKKATINL